MTAAEGLLDLPPWARHRGIILYAAGPAQRLMDWHDSRPKSEQRPYSHSWKPALHAIWAYAGGDDQAWYSISQAVGSYLLSPQNHLDGQDGPDDADQDEVAAVIFAANAVLHGLPGFADLAAGRATDAIDNRWYAVDDELGPHWNPAPASPDCSVLSSCIESAPDDFVAGDLAARELAAEVECQRSALELIARAAQDRAAWRSGAPAWLVASLRDGRS